MATSGSYDFNQNASQIVTDALELAGVIEAGDITSADAMAHGLRALNRMVKAWQGKVHLWSKKEGALFLTTGQTSYQLGPNSTDKATEENSLTNTTLSADAATSATTITVASATGIVDAYNIGIVLDDGTFHWTAVSGVSGTTVSLTVAMPSAAASGNRVYVYQTSLVRPLRITNCRRRDEVAVQDIPIIMFSRQEYMDTPNKTTQTLVTEIYYDPQLTDGRLYVWPTATDIDSTLRFTFLKPLQDMDAATNDPDFPQEWLDALAYNLAVRLCPSYGVPIQDRTWLKLEAREMLDDMMIWDDEPESVYFQPDMTGTW